MSERRPLAPTGFAVALFLASACRLDPSPKSHCLADTDCLDGRTCDHGVCIPSTVLALGGPQPAVEGGAAGFEPCDPQAAPGSCGFTGEGKARTCFDASALAGEAFCAEGCDPSQPPADAVHFTCSASGALLRRCHPNESASPAADCPADFSCYRTDLLLDEGLCIRMPVCATDADCTRGAYTKCAATVVGSIADAGPSYVRLDHLNCVHPNCESQRSACAGSEGCLGTNYTSSLADICVPRCDAALHCPPNYSCARSTSGPGSPTLCLPGVPGDRCDGPHCLVGSCDDTGAGFSVCAVPCLADSSCAPLSSTTAPFVCVDGGAYRHCVTVTPFSGANCTKDSDCQTDRGEFCSRASLYGTKVDHGECRVACRNDGTCDPIGGLPHGCLAAGSGGCFPGVEGVPCTDQSACIAPLTCEDVPAESDLPLLGARICTAPCALDGGDDVSGDASCERPLINGYCGAGWCRVPRPSQQPCQRDSQCQSHVCDPAMHLCLDAATSAVGL